MQIQDLINLPHNQKIAIIGLGRENQQFLTWLHDVVKFDFSQVVVADQKIEAVSKILDEYPEIEDVNGFAGENYLNCLKVEGVEYVFKSPGIWSLKAEFEEFRWLKGEGRITSSLVFFFAKFREQIVAITGTKGKSTTSSLISHLLNNLKHIQTDNVQLDLATRAVYCGNTTNISPYQFWTNLEQTIDPEQYFVIETSSFQLQDLGFADISPKFAVITNYFIDHQDQHGNPLEYWMSKDNIFRYQNEGDIIVANEQVLERSGYLMASPNKIILGEDEVGSLHDKIIHALPGSHNLLNVSLALSVVCAVLGVARDLAEIKHFVDLNSASFNLALASFQTLPHRIQLVHSIQDTIDLKNAGKSQNLELIINFYDDGYATEPDANIAAIKTLTSKPNEFLWIQMTGKDKGGELEELAELIQTKIESKQIYKVDLSGKVGQRIGTLLLLPNDRINLSQLTFRELVTTRFQSIFELKQQFESWVNELNLEMDSDQIILNILFSPGGSSFDEFDNSGQRADWWVERVRSMKE